LKGRSPFNLPFKGDCQQSKLARGAKPPSPLKERGIKGVRVKSGEDIILKDGFKWLDFDYRASDKAKRGVRPLPLILDKGRGIGG